MKNISYESVNWKIALQFLLALLALLTVTILGLWAWNTLSELYGGPVAQYKHVVAGLILLLATRWTLRGGS